MIRYLLDTSACVDYLRRPGSPMRGWLGSVDPGSVRLCSVVQAELLLGVQKKPTERNRRNVSRFLAFFPDSYPFDRAAAEIYARLRADLEMRGQAIGPHDTQIAAIALSRGAVLVTGNSGEFRRVPGLQCLALDELAAGRAPS